MRVKTKDIYRFRRTVAVAIIFLSIFVGFILESGQTSTAPAVLSEIKVTGTSALSALDELAVKGRAPKTGYSRSEYGSGWASVGGCDMRNIILSQQLIETETSNDDCVVLSGILNDPYSGELIKFTRGAGTSSQVQIDHVVALSDSWQKGAQKWTETKREVFANDPLNLLAVKGSENIKKGDSDAASWLPSNKGFRCRYVARQIAVKQKYDVWITSAEKSAMKRVLNECSEQILPVQD